MSHCHTTTRSPGLCRPSAAVPQDDAVREQLAERASEVIHLRGEVRRLARSRAWGVDAVAQSGELVTIAKGELEALRKDLAVRIHTHLLRFALCFRGNCCAVIAQLLTIGNSIPCNELSCAQEQEALLAAYDDANRDATHRVKALEAALKEKETSMEEERRALERDVVRALEGQQQNNVDTAAKLRCA